MPTAPTIAPTGTLETPAMRGKQARADELGERVVIARNWRYLAYCLVVTHVISLGIIAWLANQPKLIPVYIRVDTASETMQVLGSGEQGYTLRQETIKKELREFVEVLRRVSPAKALMQKQWKELFSKVTPRGHRALVQYAQETNPLAVAGERRVEILRVLAQTEQTYDIRWTESTYSEEGTMQERATYSGLFTWTLRQSSKPVSIEELTANPAGIYVDTWQWSQE